jgi:hypothetical protein
MTCPGSKAASDEIRAVMADRLAALNDGTRDRLAHHGAPAGRLHFDL